MNPWIAIVGRREDGRHAVAERLCQALRSRDLGVAGFLQEPIDHEDGVRIGYDLVDVSSGARLSLARQSPSPRICGWGFDADAFATARAWSMRESDVIFLELGRLEAAEDGHWPTALSVLGGPPRVVVLGIRPNVLASVALRLPDPEDALELPAQESEEDAFLERVIRIVEGRRGRS